MNYLQNEQLSEILDVLNILVGIISPIIVFVFTSIYRVVKKSWNHNILPRSTDDTCFNKNLFYVHVVLDMYKPMFVLIFVYLLLFCFPGTLSLETRFISLILFFISIVIVFFGIHSNIINISKKIKSILYCVLLILCDLFALFTFSFFTKLIWFIFAFTALFIINYCTIEYFLTKYKVYSLYYSPLIKNLKYVRDIMICIIF